MNPTFNSLSRHIDTSNRYPSYITSEADQFEIVYFCEAELLAWRNAVAYHHSLPTVERKLTNRRNLESAYNTLRAAYLAVCAQGELVA